MKIEDLITGAENITIKGRCYDNPMLTRYGDIIITDKKVLVQYDKCTTVLMRQYITKVEYRLNDSDICIYIYTSDQYPFGFHFAKTPDWRNWSEEVYAALCENLY